MGLTIDQILVGRFGVFCYLVSDPATMEAMLVDPGGEPRKIPRGNTQELALLEETQLPQSTHEVLCCQAGCKQVRGLPAECLSRASLLQVFAT